MRAKEMILLTTNAFILFTGFYVYTRSLWTLLFFLPLLLPLIVKRRHEDA